ncbi:MAG: hypothetical protein M3Y66_06520 [Actinomycetota bacterium]|nr:hypothetical protein [Actinomycetota bacterium]
MHETKRSPLRWVVAALLLITAAVHVPLIPGHLKEAPYAGVLFLLLAVTCAVLAGVIVRRDTPMVWELSGAVTLLALIAFLASRTIGLPQLADDVGNWTDPLGFPALAAELLTTSIAAYTLKHVFVTPSKGFS